MKKEISLDKFSRLINCGQVILVSSAYKDKSNIITLAWNMPISRKPPLLGISIANSHFSNELIKKSGEFIVNIPSVDLLDKVIYCGTRSGYEVDKFAQIGIQPKKANRLTHAPSIEDCIGNIECYVRDIKVVGDHSLFIAEAIYASAEETLFDDIWDIDKAKLIFHLGGKFFTIPHKKIKI
ncbi:MAG: flavin reductase family protein [Candidatus Omnitrophica bacterium]|nr:flavin reductase family protein [Candidatus Omnitrophota bacterium]